VKVLIGIIFFAMTYFLLENKIEIMRNMKNNKPYLRAFILFVYMYSAITFLKMI